VRPTTVLQRGEDPGLRQAAVPAEARPTV